MNLPEFFSKEKNLFKEIFLIFLASRLFIFFVGFASLFFFQKGKFFVQPNSLLDLFFAWDSGWYISIVEKGYSFVPGEFSTVAFFPLYPLLIKIFSVFFGSPKLMAYLISNISFFLALFLFYKLISLAGYSNSLAKKTVLFTAFAPLSFFFSVIYAEGLFLFLAIACFYFALKKNWFAASVFGFLVALTKPLGGLILVPLLIEYFGLNLSSYKNIN
ncbi:MAG: mannosyltransferase family protein [archaeon]